MKKFVILFLPGLLALNIAVAQTINISGTVKTADGDALHLAFVQDKQYKNGAYTDSLGNFSLAVNANSKLHIICRGFRDTLIDIKNQTVFTVVLRPLVNITATRLGATAPATISAPANADHSSINFADLRDDILLAEPPIPNRVETYTPHGGKPITVSSGAFDFVQGTIFPVFNHKEATQGSRYLFDTWMHGYVIRPDDTTIQNPALFFNYDKIGGSLLLSQDKHSAIEVYTDRIKSFTLFDALNQPYTYTMVPEIDKSHFVQVIASGNNYKIYKAIKTKFVAANYTTDGVASSGNNFDSYEDEFTYYLLNVKTNQMQKIGLKKKVLKQAFVADVTKVDTYFKTNDGDIDDNYLASLGDYMNK